MSYTAVTKWVLIGLIPACLGFPCRAEEDKEKGTPVTPETILTEFEKAWKPQKGYMRPLDDPGWKARMEAFQKLVRLGDKALPALTDALSKGAPETRTFAAQTLTFLAAPASRASLETALKDSHPPVRLYAIDALSMFGKLEATEGLKQLRQQDSNRDVRSHVGFALERDDKPQPTAIQKALLDYDLSRMDSAQVGKPAPEFALADALGKTHELKQFRGKKAVVLIFIYGDT